MATDSGQDPNQGNQTDQGTAPASDTTVRVTTPDGAPKPEPKPDAGKGDAQGAADAAGDQGTLLGGDAGKPAAKAEPLPWMKQLPSELLKDEKAVATLVKFKGPGELAQAYLSSLNDAGAGFQELLSAQSPEEQAKLWKRLGVPDSPEGYKLQADTAGIPKSEVMEKGFREAARKLNVTQAQAQGLYEFYNNAMIGLINQQRTEMVREAQATEVQLRKEWGPENFTKNIEASRRGVEFFGGAELRDFLNKTKLGNHPLMIKLFYKIGEAISEDGFVRGAPEAEPKHIPGRFRYPSMEGVAGS